MNNIENNLILILIKVCNYFDLNIKLVKSKSRKQNLVFARDIYCYEAIRQGGNTLSKIGSTINRTHCCVLFSRKKVKNEKKLLQLHKEIFEK